MRGVLSSGKSKLVAASPHCLPKPRCICASRLPQHICASAARAHLCNGTAACLPWSASQCPTMEASVRRPPIVRSRWEWEARHGSGPGPVGTHQTKPFRRQRLPSPSSVKGLWGSDMRKEQSEESLELEGTLPVGNESAVTPLSSSFVHLSLKVDLRLIFLWQAVTNVPYIEGPVVSCIVGNNSGFP